MQFNRGMIISGNADLVAELDSLLSQVASSLYLRRVVCPPDESQLETMVQSFAPSIVFLDLSNPEMGMEIASLIQRRSPGVHLIGIAGEAREEALFAAVRGGMRDVVDYPLTLSDVERGLSRALALVAEGKTSSGRSQRVVSFLPAKVGSGASTVALNSACAMAKSGPGRVALMDLDFDCGIIDFMLKFPDDYGLSQIAGLETSMDDSIWSRVVSKFGELDVLRAGAPQSQGQVSATTIGSILAFARGKYDAICVDLPGALYGSSTSVLEQSDLIFVVCTPELPSVHLARRRLEKLRDMKLGDRARIIYNRWSPAARLSKTELEQVLGSEVFATIENDYATLQQALMNGRPVDMKTPIGTTFVHLANKILGMDSGESVGPERNPALWTRLKGFFKPPIGALLGSGDQSLLSETAMDSAFGARLRLKAPESAVVPVTASVEKPGAADPESGSLDIQRLGFRLLDNASQPGKSKQSKQNRQALPAPAGHRDLSAKTK